MKIFLGRFSSLLLLFILIAFVYLLAIRPWHLQWGATEEEILRPMQGDGIILFPTFNATRVVTIQATPEEIWPWIVQIGDQRAGFYSYDWFDNHGMRSAEEIIPELQEIQIGDQIPISAAFYQNVLIIDYPNSMVWVSSDDPPTGTWAWGLYPIDDNSTRLVTRMRGYYNWTFPRIFLDLLVDAGDLPFMRKCLLGIKQRAEGKITDTYAEDVTEGTLWGVAFLEFSTSVVLMFSRRKWWLPFVVATETSAVFLMVFYLRPPLLSGGLLEAALFLILICIIFSPDTDQINPCITDLQPKKFH